MVSRWLCSTRQSKLYDKHTQYKWETITQSWAIQSVAIDLRNIIMNSSSSIVLASIGPLQTKYILGHMFYVIPHILRQMSYVLPHVLGYMFYVFGYMFLCLQAYVPCSMIDPWTYVLCSTTHFQAYVCSTPHSQACIVCLWTYTLWSITHFQIYIPCFQTYVQCSTMLGHVLWRNVRTYCPKGARSIKMRSDDQTSEVTISELGGGLWQSY